MSDKREKAPFDKFVVAMVSPCEYRVITSSPEWIRSILEIGKIPEVDQDLVNLAVIERALFIEDAIREKLERVAGNQTAKDRSVAS